MFSKLKNFVQTYIVELGVSAYLIYLLMITVPSGIYGWVTVWYALDYKYGFGSRLMLGSILHLFTGEYLSKQEAHNFLVGSLVVLCILIALFAGMVYRKVQNETLKNGVAFLTALYLASPASPAYLWTGENIGRLETYLFIIALVLAFVYFKITNTILKYILFVTLGCFAISIHQIYFLLFFPTLLVMMIQDVWESHFKINQIIYSVGAVCILSIFFLCMQFGSGIYYDNADDIYNAVIETTDLYIDKAPIEMEYFWTLKDNFIKNQLPELHDRLRFGALTVVMLAPMWGIYLIIWFLAIKNNKEQKYKYILMLLTNIAYVPVFALMTDWGRWFAAFFVVQFLNLLILMYKDDKGIKNGMNFVFNSALYRGGGIIPDDTFVFEWI